MILSWRFLTGIILLPLITFFVIGITQKNETHLPETTLMIPALAGTYFIYKDLHERIDATPYAFAKIEHKSDNKVHIRLSKKAFSHPERAEQEAQEATQNPAKFWNEVFVMTVEEMNNLNIQKIIGE